MPANAPPIAEPVSKRKNTLDTAAGAGGDYTPQEDGTDTTDGDNDEIQDGHKAKNEEWGRPYLAPCDEDMRIGISNMPHGNSAHTETFAEDRWKN